MLELREDTAVWANNIFCPKVDQVETHFSGLAFGSQNLQNWGYSPPPKMPQNGTFGVGPAAGVGRCALRCATRPITFAFWTVRAVYTVGIAFP